MNFLERSIKNACRSLGVDIRRIPRNELGVEPFTDIKAVLSGQEDILIIDVGANIGQSVREFKKIFKKAAIHSFEPSEQIFHRLKKNTAQFDKVTAVHGALSGQNGRLDLIENSVTELSSFLPPSESCWGKVTGRQSVPVRTLDDYCRESGIAKIDVLKSDTQGFELEVLKGAQRLLETNSIHLVFMEMIISDMYEGAPSFEDLYRCMTGHRFQLVAFYNIHVRNHLAGWLDALFINNAFSR